MTRLWHTLAALLAWACVLLPVEPARAQSTQPAGSPVAAQLRDAAHAVEFLHARSQRLELELARLQAAGVEPYVQGMVLEAGRTYRLPTGQPVAINVTVPNVTLIGGHVWPFPDGAQAAVTARAGGDGLKVIGTRFSWDQGPAGWAKLKGPAGRELRQCVLGLARNVRVIDCTFDRVNHAVSILAPGSGALIQDNFATADVRSAFVYVGGGRHVRIIDNLALDSTAENLVRCSPENGVVPEDVLIAYNDLQNLHSKCVVELRSVNGAVVWRNTLRGSHGHACFSVGRKTLEDGPGATNVRVLENDCFFGRGEVDAGAADVEVAGNTFRGLRYGTEDTKEGRATYDIALKADGSQGTLKNLRVKGNVGYLPGGAAATIKPFFAGTLKETIPGLEYDDFSNGWRNEAPPATQPTSEPAQ